MNEGTPSPLAIRLAQHAWRKAGRPEREPGEPTSVGYDWYLDQAQEVLRSITDLGLAVTPAAPEAPRLKAVRSTATGRDLAQNMSPTDLRLQIRSWLGTARESLNDGDPKAVAVTALKKARDALQHVMTHAYMADQGHVPGFLGPMETFMSHNFVTRAIIALHDGESRNEVQQLLKLAVEPFDRPANAVDATVAAADTDSRPERPS